MDDEKETIVCCQCCGEPLIPTLLFIGAEYYCIHCKSNYGLLDRCHKEGTPQLKAKATLLNQVYRAITQNIFFNGHRLRECRECEKEDHVCHMTDIEKFLHDESIKLLAKIRIN